MNASDATHAPSLQPTHRASVLNGDAFAHATIRGSKRHIVLTLVMTLVLLGAGVVLGGTEPVLAVIGALGALVVAYNLFRIRAARSALKSPQQVTAFITAQKRSHLLRGKVYLITSPLLLVGTGTGLVLERPTPPVGAWILFAAISAFLAYGWVWWVRALRRVKLWQPSITEQVHPS